MDSNILLQQIIGLLDGATAAITESAWVALFKKLRVSIFPVGHVSFKSSHSRLLGNHTINWTMIESQWFYEWENKRIIRGIIPSFIIISCGSIICLTPKRNRRRGRKGQQEGIDFWFSIFIGRRGNLWHGFLPRPPPWSCSILPRWSFISYFYKLSDQMGLTFFPISRFSSLFASNFYQQTATFRNLSRRGGREAGREGREKRKERHILSDPIWWEGEETINQSWGWKTRGTGLLWLLHSCLNKGTNQPLTIRSQSDY